MVLLLHLALTGFLTGLAWFVALVHYPLFLNIQNFSAYEREHIRRTMPLTLSTMLGESALSLWLAILYPTEVWVWVNGGGAILIWLSTMLWQVPLHYKMVKEPTLANRRRMIRSHWPRTLLWTLRLMLLTYYALPGF